MLDGDEYREFLDVDTPGMRHVAERGGPSVFFIDDGLSLDAGDKCRDGNGQRDHENMAGGRFIWEFLDWWWS